MYTHTLASVKPVNAYFFQWSNRRVINSYCQWYFYNSQSERQCLTFKTDLKTRRLPRQPGIRNISALVFFKPTYFEVKHYLCAA